MPTETASPGTALNNNNSSTSLQSLSSGNLTHTVDENLSFCQTDCESSDYKGIAAADEVSGHSSVNKIQDLMAHSNVLKMDDPNNFNDVNELSYITDSVSSSSSNYMDADDIYDPQDDNRKEVSDDDVWTASSKRGKIRRKDGTSEDDDSEYEERKAKPSKSKFSSRISKVKKSSSKNLERYGVTDEEDESLPSDFEGDSVKKSTAVSYEIPFYPKDLAQKLIDKIVCKRYDKEEIEFLVKWKSMSHQNNSWETKKSIIDMGGERKLKNFCEDPERFEADIDVEELCTVEKIIDDCHDEETGMDYYLVKWFSSPYLECTWETFEDIKEFSGLIDEYTARLQSGGIPTCAKSLHRRFHFRKLQEPPPYISSQGVLRDYQLEGINWLIYSWCRGVNVILADEMGLGKTVQTVSFISSLIWEYGFTGPVLVVVPLSTIAAWKREFSRWAPALQTILYIGDSQSRGTQRFYEWFAEDVVDGPQRRRSGQMKPWPLFNVLLTTYELVLKDKEFLEDVDWRMLVVDEGHRLKNSSSQLHEILDRLSPSSRLLITGTPLQNSMIELWSLLHFLMPQKFPNFEDFLLKYGPPGNDDNEDADRRLENLHKVLKPHLLRRMKKDVECSLPSKMERILRVELNNRQKELSRLIITKNYRDLTCQTKRNVGSLNNVLMELKKVCNHSSILGTGSMEPLSLDEILRGSSKMALLDQLLNRLHRDGHRVLIFSQMVKMLDILSLYLKLKKWNFQRLDGSAGAESRKNSIALFNSIGSEDFCFLLSTRAGGLGINLETADTVILYDSDWNPQNDIQAMARAHRIGQTKSVNIYRLVSKNSVEETILERAKQKMVLDQLVIQSMDTSGRTPGSRGVKADEATKKISRDELQAILKFGAQELFKDSKDDPSMDLDSILNRADDINEPTLNGENGFFDQFKVADFGAIDWDQILPSDIVDDAKTTIVEEDNLKQERALQEVLLAAATKRKRKNSCLSHAAAIVDSKNSIKNSLSKKRPSYREPQDFGDQKYSIGLNKTVTRSLINHLLRFGCIEERSDRIIEELWSEHGEESVNKEEVNIAIRVIKHFIDSDFGSVKLSNLVHVNLSQLRERTRLLQYLHSRVQPHFPTMWKDFTITEKGIKAVPSTGPHRWMIEWNTPLDDARLLIGVYKYGFGKWLEISQDEGLELAKLKQYVDIADEKYIPKPIHLGRRVENVISHMIVNGPCRDKPKKANSLEQNPRSINEERSEEKFSRDNKIHEKSSEKYDEAKRVLRPVRKDLLFLSSLTEDCTLQKADSICEALLRIGNLISSIEDPDRIWKFVTNFWPTEITRQELSHFYGRISEERR